RERRSRLAPIKRRVGGLRLRLARGEVLSADCGFAISTRRAPSRLRCGLGCGVIENQTNHKEATAAGKSRGGEEAAHVLAVSQGASPDPGGPGDVPDLTASHTQTPGERNDESDHDGERQGCHRRY